MDDMQAGRAGEREMDKPIPFDDGGVEVSHSPLNLGGGGSEPEAASEQAAQPSGGKDTMKRMSWPDRITGVKTFFTKLHQGSIDFMDGQICDWLRDNPGVNVRRTNVISGDVVGKKTEPNIIVTVWY